MTHRRRSAAILLACAAGGCTAPRTPPSLTPLSETGLGLSPTTSPEIVDAWWTALGDPQLDRIMAEALVGNPTIAMALARLRAAEAGIAASRAGMLPQIDAGIQEQRQRFSGRYIIPPAFAGSYQWVGSAQANLSWTIDLAGRQQALVDQSRADAQAAGLDAAAGRLAIVGAIAQTYLNLARADAQVAIAREFVVSRQSSLRLVRDRIAYQLDSDFSARAAETMLAQARQAQVRAEGGRMLMVHALAALAGRGADFYPTVGPTAVRLAAALPLPVTVPADLLGRRPDVLAARARIDAALAGQKVARADFYPNVDLRAFAGLSAIGLGDLFSTEARTYGAGPALHLPIFQGGRLRARYAVATAEADAAIAGYNETVLRAVREVTDGISAVETARGDAAAQHDLLSGLQETVRLDRVRVGSGLGSQLDLLASGDRLLAARQAEADIVAEGALRRVQLLLALGGGFKSSEPEARKTR